MMKLKHKIYAKLKSLVTTKYGVAIMALLCFLESCVLPLTPMVMLIPLVLINPNKKLKYINIATIASLLGSMVGYSLGYFLISYLNPYIESWGYAAEFLKIENWFASYGLLVLLPASVLPFPPFKIFTIVAGALHIKIIPFLITVTIVRWIHFVIIPLLAHFGQKAYLAKYEDKLTGLE